MSRLVRAVCVLGAAGALGLALTSNTLAEPSPSAELGQHVATCAQVHLGQREDASSVTCTHDAMTMTFPTFGAMVQHMQEMHAG